MIILIFSFFVSTILTGFVIKYKHLHNHLSGDHDLDGPQKFHTSVTPRIGGIPILSSLFVSFCFIWFIYPWFAKPLFLIFLSSLPIFISGIYEDITKKSGVTIRLLSAFFSGLLFLWLFNITSIRFGYEILNDLFNHTWFVVLFLSFGTAGLSNAYNIIDGFNGLASMVAIIALLAICYVSFKVFDPIVFNLALIMVGAICGFFVWNYPKGLIFLGDGGAYLIGFMISILSILLVVRNSNVSPWFAIMVSAYPIFETIFTIWRRSIHKGRNPGLPDGAHFHSLIYRRIMRWSQSGEQSYLANSKTSPYLWLLSSIGVIPALLWWDSTIKLSVSAIFFIILYNITYRQIVTFRASHFLGCFRKNR